MRPLFDFPGEMEGGRQGSRLWSSNFLLSSSVGFTFFPPKAAGGDLRPILTQLSGDEPGALTRVERAIRSFCESVTRQLDGIQQELVQANETLIAILAKPAGDGAGVG